jgi:alkylation response protein AidB-like acyl-CoA dehydrogenase
MATAAGQTKDDISFGPFNVVVSERLLTKEGVPVELGARALDIALDRAAGREAFGARLQDLGIVQAQIADAVIDLDSSRALVRQVAGVLDAGVA